MFLHNTVCFVSINMPSVHVHAVHYIPFCLLFVSTRFTVCVCRFNVRVALCACLCASILTDSLKSARTATVDARPRYPCWGTLEEKVLNPKTGQQVRPWFYWATSKVLMSGSVCVDARPPWFKKGPFYPNELLYVSTEAKTNIFGNALFVFLPRVWGEDELLSVRVTYEALTLEKRGSGWPGNLFVCFF